MNKNLVHIVKTASYMKKQSREVGKHFRTVGVRKWCFLFSIDHVQTLEHDERTEGIGSRPVTNLCFADDISRLADLQELKIMVQLPNHS